MHWCLGMYGSGSTWIFNTARKAAEALFPDRPIQSGFAVNCRDLGFLRDEAGVQIVKTHDTDDALKDLLRRQATAVLLSIRDPRDCLASLLEYHRLAYEECLGRVLRSTRFCSELIGHPNAILLRYEDAFIEDPSTIDSIALTFGKELTVVDHDRIFQETRRLAIEELISKLDSLPTVFHHADPAETLDVVTQWHRHHAGRTGEIGRWRNKLTTAQVADVERELGSFIDTYRYRSV